jgi:hypothetical protein
VRRLVFAVLASLAAAPLAVAAPRDRGELFGGARLGVALPDAWSKLGPSYVVAVEAGWAMPVLRHRLALALDAAFTAPIATGSGTDPALGAYTFRLEAREVILGVSVTYRHAFGRIVPYAGLGPRLVVFDAHLQGSAGAARLPPSSEVAVGGGGGGFIGVGVRLGPGELFLDARADAAPVHDRLSGDVVAGALFVAGGYRVVF